MSDATKKEISMKLRSRRRELSLTALGVLAVAISAAVVLFGTAGSAAGAPGTDGATVDKKNVLVYSAQFNCGMIPQGNVQLDPLQPLEFLPIELAAKPANYATDINVHNPQFFTVPLSKKAVLSGWVAASPSGVTSSKPEEQFKGGQIKQVQLATDGAFEIDCADIFNVLRPPSADFRATFIKGFVVIYSRSELDVSATYTSERVGTTTYTCLLSNGDVADHCPSSFPPPGVTRVGITTVNTGTGLTQDVQYITPKTVAVPAHSDPIGAQP